LITGEAGTGKELFARAIHQRSTRRERPFVAVDCAGLSDKPFQRSSVGHDNQGVLNDLFELAHDSTIFFDEVGEFALGLQSKLLSLLFTRKFERVGGHASGPYDVRFIAATSRDLVKEVSQGLFRKDLYHRLRVVSVDVPPLRERKEDIPLLAAHFIRRFAEKSNCRITGLSPDTEYLLLRYDWPANVRELEEVIERAVIVAQAEHIFPEDLPKKLLY
jgi:two-component system response regulator AtoC